MTPSGSPEGAAAASVVRTTDAGAWRALVDRFLPASLDTAGRMGLSGRRLDDAVGLAWLQLSQRPGLPVQSVPSFLAASISATARRAAGGAQVIDLRQSNGRRQSYSAAEEMR